MDDGDNVLLVGTRGEFRDDAAVLFVNFLRSDDVGKDAVVAKDGGGGVVTGGFDGKNDGHKGWVWRL